MASSPGTSSFQVSCHCLCVVLEDGSERGKEGRREGGRERERERGREGRLTNGAHSKNAYLSMYTDDVFVNDTTHR